MQLLNTMMDILNTYNIKVNKNYCPLMLKTKHSQQINSFLSVLQL